MSESLDARAKAVFDEAVDWIGGERSDYLDRACVAAPELRARVEALLAAAEKNDSFLGAPTVLAGATALSGNTRSEFQSKNERPGAKIGPFELIEPIGEGGFGVVFLARQSTPVRRDVALKIIKAGMDTRQVIARFEAERRALARMDHPNIARVLEAGATDAGRPYFVMELVRGEPITKFCDRKRLGLDKRLALIRSVCAAVQHAHQKGIIHRDLKPSNILVGAAEDGTPSAKVIDFGIAKAVLPDGEDGTLTQLHQRLGTPNYMSPEQLQSGDSQIDTRTDIYSLGVVLYELLTGSTPFQRVPSDGSKSSAAAASPLHDEPLRPSARIRSLASSSLQIEPARLALSGGRQSNDSTSLEVAQRRQTAPATLIRTLRRDLDWIVLKCLEKDRARRYETASALADDIGRYLENQPVQATPPSAGYRFRKFVRRNRVAVVAGAAITAALFLGAIGTILGLLRAVESQQEALVRADETRAINEFMRDILTQASPDALGADVRLAQVLETASAQITSHFAGHPLQAASAHELLADVFDKLTQFPKAQREAQAALRLYQQHAHPDDPAALLCLRRCIAAAVNLSQVKEVEQRLADAQPRFVRVFGPNSEHTQDLRRCEAWVHLRSGRPDQAEEIFLQLRAHPTQSDDERQIRILRHLITVQKFRSNSVNRDDRGPYWASAEALAREALELAMRHFGPDAVSTLGLQLEVAEALYHLDCHEEAAQMCRSVLARDLSRFGPCHHLRREAYSTLADCLARLGHDREAAELTLQKLACVRESTTPGNVILIGALYQSLPFLERAGLAVEGETIARELVALVAPYGEERAGHLFSATNCLARFLTLQNRFDEAEELFAKQFALIGGVPPNGRIAWLHRCYGLHLAARGAFAEAEAELNKAVSAAGDVRAGTWYSHPDDLIMGFIELYRLMGKPENVREYEQLRAETFGQTVH